MKQQHYFFIVVLVAAFIGCGNQNNTPAVSQENATQQNHELKKHSLKKDVAEQEGVDSTIYSQASQDIPISVVIPETPVLPKTAIPTLENKIRQIAANYGLSSNGIGHFAMTANVSILKKDIVPTNPPRASETLEITVYIGDLKEDKIYGSYIFQVEGIGTTDGKAMINALQNIKPKSAELSKFINGAKEKIIAYYNANYPKMIASADALVSARQYEEAIYMLLPIPQACEGYEKTLPIIVRAHNEKINLEGRKLYQEAKSLWATNVARNSVSLVDASAYAEQALAIIAQIDPAADCQSEASKLVDEIMQKMSSLDSRNKQWAFDLKKYTDSLDAVKQERADAQAIRMAEIEAERAISITEAEHQPKFKMEPLIKFEKTKNWCLGAQVVTTVDNSKK